jgi:hypothetical protein
MNFVSFHQLCPHQFMNFGVWDYSPRGNWTFGCGKVYYSKFITITSFVCELLVQIIGLKISSLSILELTSPKNNYHAVCGT